MISDTEIQVGIQKTPTANLTGQGFAIAVGNGYTEQRHNDNNINRIIGGLWRLNAGAGVMANGLYGPKLHSMQMDINGFYNVAVGTCDQEQVLNTRMSDMYFEGTLGASILFGCAAGFIVDLPTYDYTSSVPLYHKAATLGTQNVGIIIDHTGIEAVGTANSTVPSTITDSSFLFNGQLYARGETQSVSAAVAINPAPFLVHMSLGAPVTMSATPTISDGDIEGKEVELHNYAGGNALTLRDESVLPGSKLRLSAGTLVLNFKDSIKLRWSGGKWVQIGHTALV